MGRLNWRVMCFTVGALTLYADQTALNTKVPQCREIEMILTWILYCISVPFDDEDEEMNLWALKCKTLFFDSLLRFVVVVVMAYECRAGVWALFSYCFSHAHLCASTQANYSKCTVNFIVIPIAHKTTGKWRNRSRRSRKRSRHSE